MSHTESDLDVIYMGGKIIPRSFQWHLFQAQIHPESTGIVCTIGHPESVPVLRCRLLVFWAVYRGPIRGASKGYCTTLETLLAAATFLLVFGFSLSYSVKNSSPIDRFVRPQLECLINHLQFSRLCSSLFFFVSSIPRQGLALVARSIVQRMVDNQRRSGAAIAWFESC
jgi:hypothetical protein